MDLEKELEGMRDDIQAIRNRTKKRDSNDYWAQFAKLRIFDGTRKQNVYDMMKLQTKVQLSILKRLESLDEKL